MASAAAHSAIDGAKMSAGQPKNVGTGYNVLRPQNSPDTAEIEMLKHADWWRRVKVDDIDVFIWQNWLLNLTRSIDETTGNGDGKWTSKVDGTMSSSHTDLIQGEDAQLAGESQPVHCSQELKTIAYL